MKRVRKRTRRRSSSRDVSEGSPPVMKKKGSNRKSLDYGRKTQKKKRKRHASIRSASSDSRSCSSCRRENSISSRGRDSKSFSTCQDETNSGNEDINLQVPRIKSRKKLKEKKICNETSIGRRSESRGPVCSLCNHHSCSCNTSHSGKEYAEESNPKRLRSVITIPEKTREEEGDEQGPDMRKEEILIKHHDCPSYRNQDNSDLEIKQKLASCSCFPSNQIKEVGNSIIDDAFPPNSETFGPTKVGVDMDPPDKIKGVSHDNAGESGSSDNIANTGVEDLETVLRKKALENLQKFRKELQTNTKSDAKEKKNDSDVNQLSSSKTEVVPYKTLEQGKKGVALNQVVECRSKLVITEEFSHSTVIEINTPVEENNDGKGSGCIEQGVTQPADRSVLSQSPEQEDHTNGPIISSEPEPGKLLSSTTVQTYKKENPMASKGNIIKTPVPLRPEVLRTGTSNNLDMGAVNAGTCATIETTSSFRSTSDGLTSNYQPDEIKDASEFEQKTMSVMRGGEMVQVLYSYFIIYAC